jgi:hypothetical protein
MCIQLYLFADQSNTIGDAGVLDLLNVAENDESTQTYALQLGVDGQGVDADCPTGALVTDFWFHLVVVAAAAAAAVAITAVLLGRFIVVWIVHGIVCDDIVVGLRSHDVS